MTQFAVDAQGNRTHQLSEDGTEWIPIPQLPSHPASPPSQPGTKAELDQLLSNLGQIQPDPNDPLSQLTGGFVTTGAGNPGIESLLQGATFGFSDELQDVVGGDKEAIRQGQEGLSTGQQVTGNVIGGLLTGGILGNLLKGTKTGQTLATAAQAKPKTVTGLTGAVTGGITGAGHAPDLESVPSEMLKGAGLGGAFGFLGTGAVNLGKRAIEGTAKGLRSGVTLDPKTLATNQLVKELQRDGVDPDDLIQSLNKLGPDGRLIDAAGPNVKSLGQTVVSTPGKARALAETALGGRSKQSVNRLITDAKKFLGTDKNLFQTTKNLIKSRSEAAKPLYDNLKGQRPVLTDEFAEFMQRPALASAFKQGIIKAKNDGVKIPKKLESGNVIPFEVVDFTKRSLDDQIGTALRQGKRDAARQLMNMKNGLVDFADESFPGYAEARKTFTDQSSMLNASQLGKQILKTDADEMADIVSSMPESERQMFVVGALKSISDKIKGTAEGSDAGKRFSTALIKERIRPAFPDDDSFNKFLQGVEREGIFQQSKGILGGSPTQPRLASEAVRAEDIALDAATGNVLNTALNSVRNFVKGQKTIPEGVKDEIGELLFSSFAKGQPLSNKVVSRLKKHKVSKAQIEDLMTSLRFGVGITSGVVAGE